MQKARHHQRQRFTAKIIKSTIPKSCSTDHCPISSHSEALAPALTACRHTVSGSISLPSRGPFHLSLTVLLRYQSPNVFSLTGWSPRIHPGFLVPRATRDTATKTNLFQLRDYHPLRSTFPDLFVYKFVPDVAVPLPRPHGRFRLFPVRSPLLRESLLLSLPVATKMFQFTTFASGLRRMTGLQPAGLPHSEIPGLMLAYS